MIKIYHLCYTNSTKIEAPMHSLPQDHALDEQIETAVKTLENGGVCAIPTDTLYGLAACAFDDSAVEKVYELKGRPEGMALPLLLSDATDLKACAEAIPQEAWLLAERFWPGALTLVLRKADIVPAVVTAGMDTVAVRVPDHLIPRAIASRLGAPITGTSANRSGGPELTSAAAVRAEFGDAIDFVLDGGDAPGGVASTILELSKGTPRALRQGAVSWEEIESVIRGVDSQR